MNINSYSLKLSGKAELPEDIQIGDNYHVSLEGTVESESTHDNHDGTYSKIYTFKPVKVDLLDPKGKALRLKDPRKNSQKIRNFLWKLHEQEGYGEDFERVYDEATWIILRDMPITLREAIKKIKG